MRCQSSCQNDDIGDNYGEPPEDLRTATSWLGLFTTQGTSADQPGQSRLAAARVRFVKSSDPAGGWELKTTPPNATLLISGVRNVVPGPAVTVTQSERLDRGKPELQNETRPTVVHAAARLSRP